MDEIWLILLGGAIGIGLPRLLNVGADKPRDVVQDDRITRLNRILKQQEALEQELQELEKAHGL